jgi:secondary thiamine-phosphate synthase enzyme
MRFHTEYLKFQTKQHREYINITGEVNAALKKSGIREGMILVSAMHITAGVWVNDAEDGLLADIDEWLEKLAPYRDNYRHHRTGETNGDSHLKSLLVGDGWAARLRTLAAGLLCRVRRTTRQTRHH